MANPLKLLSKLRRYDGSAPVEKYLQTEMRQNLKAIEDAFRKLGVDLSDQESEINDLNSTTSETPYSLYCLKTSNLPTINMTEITITQWDTPTEEVGDAGTFNPTTGEWVCNREATFIFFGRCGLAANSGEEATVRWYLDGVAQTAANNLSIARRGPTASFGRRISAGQVVSLSIETVGNTAMSYTSKDPIVFNVIQVSL